MKPILNINEAHNYTESINGEYVEKRLRISKKLLGNHLGYSLSVIPPGKKAYPYHNHHINEEVFLVLEGSGILRFGSKEYDIKQNDIISCPPGGKELAHQIINNSNMDLKIFCFSTNLPYDICEYPDSGKIMSMVGESGDRHFKHISFEKDNVEYFDGE